MGTTKLKIGVFVWSFPTTSETFIVNQICDLLDRGHQVIIFAFRKGDGKVLHKRIIEYDLLSKCFFLEEISTSRILRYYDFSKFILKYHHFLDFGKMLEIFNFRKYGKKALNLRNFLKYKWILAHGDFDIFHVHFGPNALYVTTMKEFGFYTKTKLIVTFHGYDLAPAEMEKNRHKYRSLFKSVDSITVNTPYLYTLLRLVTEKNAEVLPVGLNISSFQKIENEGERTNKFNILFVGRLIKLKGVLLAVEIAKKLIQMGKKDIFLTIIGEGKLKDALLQKIKSLKLESHVILKGALPQEEVIREMGIADVFLLPGIYDSNGRAESQGLVVQEAQAMELPVVVSDVGGMKYGLKDGETGFVVEAKNIEAFAEKIQILMDDSELRIRMGRKGREFVSKKYDSKFLGNQLEKVYYRPINFKS